MKALDETDEDYLIPCCIILLKSSGNPELLDREKLESESFRKHISEDVSSDFLSSDSNVSLSPSGSCLSNARE